jgi:hypothetical protein
MASYLIPVTADGGFIQAVPAGEIPVEYATESDVTTAISNLIDTAPTALNTLNELAAALGDDANYASTITTALGAKADTSSLATVATSGSYTDLSNKPTIPTNTNQLTNGAGFLTSVGTISYNDLTNKPTIPTNTNQLTNGAGFLVSSDISGKQATLVSGTSIKTINNTSLLGSGNVAVQPTLVSGTNIKTINGTSVLGSGDISISGGAPTYNYNDTVGFGYQTGTGTGRVLLGNLAGNGGGDSYSIAIGHIAGQANQGGASIAIGQGAGYYNQGNYSIAIGYNAGNNYQNANSIVLNASGSTLDTNQSGFFVKPVRSDATPTDIIYYNSATGEMTYGTAPGGSSGGGGGGANTDWYSITATSGGVGVTTLTAPVGLDISMTNSANPKLFVGGEDMSYPSGIAPFSPPSMDWMENMGQSINSYSYNGMEAPLSISFDTVVGGVRWAMAPSCISGEICYVQYMPSNRNSSAVNYMNGLMQLPSSGATSSEVHGITMIGSGSLVTATAVNCTIHESIQGYGYTYVVWSMTKAQSDAVNNMADMMTFPGSYVHFTYYWFKHPL